jgi:L-alanine-DL-glutamate epimerase-like enolase superfamily enzyme
VSGRIERAEVIVCSPGRNFVTLKLTTSDGMLHPGEEPGHGASIDEQAAAQFPYDRAYLPVNRLEDGTLHSW